MTGFGPSQPEVGSTGRVEYSQDLKVPHQSNYSWSFFPLEFFSKCRKEKPGIVGERSAKV